MRQGGSEARDQASAAVRGDNDRRFRCLQANAVKKSPPAPPEPAELVAAAVRAMLDLHSTQRLADARTARILAQYPEPGPVGRHSKPLPAAAYPLIGMRTKTI